jgi:hypothetical protein
MSIAKPEESRENWINRVIAQDGVNTNLISDGYHTFGELYEHRIRLFITLCAIHPDVVWKSQSHSDGSFIEGWFVMGIEKEPGRQITYRLPMSYWDECNFCEVLASAPPFDGHTAADVLERLKNLDW